MVGCPGTGRICQTILVFILERATTFFFQAEDGIRYLTVTGVQTCALPISIVRTGMTETPRKIACMLVSSSAGEALGHSRSSIRTVTVCPPKQRTTPESGPAPKDRHHSDRRIGAQSLRPSALAFHKFQGRVICPWLVAIEAIASASFRNATWP